MKNITKKISQTGALDLGHRVKGNIIEKLHNNIHSNSKA